MKIIAIDPGSIYFGLCELEDNNIQKIYDWHFKGKEIRIRYNKIAQKLSEYLNENKADYYAVETTWFSSWSKNAQSAIKISIVRGIVIGAIFTSNKEAKVVDISPQETRSTFNLPRNASKEDIHRAMEMEFGKEALEGSSEDGRDAAALGIAAYYKVKKSLLVQEQL